jgi:ubiquinone/menaquinone biosynthesis C-methylase UbiE
LGRSRSEVWREAGRRADRLGDAADVVRDTGWVFNSVPPDRTSIDEFVRQGTDDVERWFSELGVCTPDDEHRTIVEIGAGIGRMTVELTRRYGRVVAADVDAGFLERCRETVARCGRLSALETSVVVDGRRLALPDATADVTFSYITLQHCPTPVALDLAAEAVRVTAPGGMVALNFRTWSSVDVVLWPVARLVRLLWRIAPRLSARSRWLTRLGWQASRIGPAKALVRLDEEARRRATVVISAKRRSSPALPTGVPLRRAADLNRAHWFLCVGCGHPAS